MVCVSLIFNFQFSILNSQEPVASVTRYRAVVYPYNDSVSQHIALDWSPSATPDVMGYHICSGDPCLGLDTVFGRLSTHFDCLDHSPAEPHVYRIHAFDSTYDVSALTPPFGPSLLTASVPECATTVSLRWSPYTGMPGGVQRYTLLMFTDWSHPDTLYELCSVGPDGPLLFSYDLPDSLPGTLGFFVAVVANDSALNSRSNTVAVHRRTADTAAFLRADLARLADDVSAVDLRFTVDTAFHAAPYTLYRRSARDPWRPLATLVPTSSPALAYTDCDISPYDSLLCYRLGVFDACGINEKFSDTLCVLLPTPADPHAFFPNIVIVGDPDNGLFLPVTSGLKGDLYDLSVFNRNGLLVFRTTDPAQPWNPAAAPQGSYTYSLRVRFVDNTVHTYTGTFLVIK